MIQIVGPHLTQWDDGREIQVTDTEATHAHFANQGDSSAVVMALVDGKAKIPNYLLQTGKSLCVYLVLNKVTQESKTFYVSKRERPEEYVYDDDRRNYIYELITGAENAAAAASEAADNANAATAGAIAATEKTNTATENAKAAAGDANTAAASANEAAFKAAHTAKSLMVVGTASGETIVLDDAIDQYLVGCRIFGKTTQDGIPTPDAPVELVSVENPVLAVNEQSMVVPYTLRGIPVSSGGNYTDANGQQWVCDEVDFARGVLVQRCFTETLAFKYQDDLDRYSAIVSHEANVNCADGLGIPLICDTYAFNPNAGYGVLVDGNLVVADGIRIAVGSPLYAIARHNGEPIGNTTVVYPIAKPIETPLSEEELVSFATLHTSRGITTVSNDAGAYMEIQYAMDAKKYIDSLVGTSAGLVNATVE